jgi:hypothetical protein
MIPASYLFKDVYRQHWGDPSQNQPVALERPRRRSVRASGVASRIYSALAATYDHLRRSSREPRGPQQDAQCYGV